MNKFKVGDRVKWTVGEAGPKHGVIDQVVGAFEIVVFEDGTDQPWRLDPYMVSAAPTHAPKFKVGDRVHDTSSKRDGTIQTVSTKVDVQYEIAWDTGGISWCSDYFLCLAKPFANEPGVPTTMLPTDAKERKATPITTGVLDYFPLALAEIARVSKAGNDQHNPGQPLHWAKGKSTDHADCLVRHLLERGTKDTDGQRHSAKMAWRALALLQTELEEEVKK